MEAFDRDAVCVPNEDPEWDWYTIQWAEHDGKHWIVDGMAGRALRYSGRLLRCSDIEGTGRHMLEIADAIENGSSASEKRCAVRTLEDGTVELWSPRNSMSVVRVTRRVALGIAASIREVVE